mmetsp:Transcript_6425/g.13173  ORF Transcript_6425/g.13173 Transcript_6425/m.13173 type:complete len:270 (+) Transcript_6425:61-870(+)
MASWEPFLEEFKAWYTAVDGFGEYLKHFLAHYGHFFREHQETHAFVYTKLHREFSWNLEAAVNAWLASKGLTEEHLAAMLEYAQSQGDQHTHGIVDAMLTMMEYQSWIKYILDLKQNPQVVQLVEEQASKAGWDRLGDAEVYWGVKSWEQWSDAEWENWWAPRQNWSDGDWEDWWGEQESWSGNWTEKTGAWRDKTWTWEEPEGQEALPEAGATILTVAVPEGLVPGAQLQVATPDGQVLVVTVPEGAGPGDTFSVSYEPLSSLASGES